jgi:hypothetical protein
VTIEAPALVTAALTIFFVSRVSTQSRPVVELKPRYRALAQAVAAADLAALAAVYVVDGTFEMRSPTANDRVRGHEGIAAQWQSILRWELVVFLTFADGNRAREFERYLKSGSGRAFSKRHFR